MCVIGFPSKGCRPICSQSTSSDSTSPAYGIGTFHSHLYSCIALALVSVSPTRSTMSSPMYFGVISSLSHTSSSSNLSNTARFERLTCSFRPPTIKLSSCHSSFPTSPTPLNRTKPYLQSLLFLFFAMKTSLTSPHFLNSNHIFLLHFLRKLCEVKGRNARCVPPIFSFTFPSTCQHCHRSLMVVPISNVVATGSFSHPRSISLPHPLSVSLYLSHLSICVKSSNTQK